MAKKKTEIQELSEFVRDNMVTRKEFQEEIGEVNKKLDGHTTILNDHTRRLNVIENDVKTGLDKRLQLEVRVANLEKTRRS